MAFVQQKKCSIQGCGKWEFERNAQLCRPCMTKFPQVSAAVAKHRDTEPIKTALIVRQAIASEHYLGVQPGDRVDVLDILSDNISVIIRSADGTIGFFNLDFLATDEEVGEPHRSAAHATSPALAPLESRIGVQHMLPRLLYSPWCAPYFRPLTCPSDSLTLQLRRRWRNNKQPARSGSAKRPVAERKNTRRAYGGYVEAHMDRLVKPLVAVRLNLVLRRQTCSASQRTCFPR